MKEKEKIQNIFDYSIKDKEHIVIIDSKEEYLNKYHEELEKKGYDIKILNLKDKSKSNSWNPLQEIYKYYHEGNKELAIKEANMLSKTLLKDQNENDPFWTDTASDYLTGCMLALIEEKKENKCNLKELTKMIEEGELRVNNTTKSNEYFSKKELTDPSYIFASNTLNAPIDTRTGIIQTLKNRINYYTTNEELIKLLSSNEIDFNKLFKKPTIIFIIGKEESELLNRLIYIFINELYEYTSINNLDTKINYISNENNIVNNINRAEW